MARPVVLIHGYSAEGKDFANLKQALVARGIDSKDINICNYISLNNEITIKDIAEGLDRARLEDLAALRLRNGRVVPDPPAQRPIGMDKEENDEGRDQDFGDQGAIGHGASAVLELRLGKTVVERIARALHVGSERSGARRLAALDERE